VSSAPSTSCETTKVSVYCGVDASPQPAFGSCAVVGGGGGAATGYNSALSIHYCCDGSDAGM
jgi:hypothetical protein